MWESQCRAIATCSWGRCKISSMRREAPSCIRPAIRKSRYCGAPTVVKCGANVNSQNKDNSSKRLPTVGDVLGDLGVQQAIRAMPKNSLVRKLKSRHRTISTCPRRQCKRPLWRRQPIVHGTSFPVLHVVELRVRCGADVNAQNKSNSTVSTPLHRVSGSGFLDMVPLLLARGTSADLKETHHRSWH